MIPHRYSAALRRVAPHLAQHRAGADLLRYLACRERLVDPDAEGWETAEAVYWLGVHWHGGQSCPFYAAQCASEFTPGRAQSGPSDEDAVCVLDDLAAIVRCAGGER